MLALVYVLLVSKNICSVDFNNSIKSVNSSLKFTAKSFLTAFASKMKIMSLLNSTDHYTSVSQVFPDQPLVSESPISSMLMFQLGAVSQSVCGLLPPLLFSPSSPLVCCPAGSDPWPFTLTPDLWQHSHATPFCAHLSILNHWSLPLNFKRLRWNMMHFHCDQCNAT